MQVVTVGVSHNSSSIGLRERLAVGADALPALLWRLREATAEAFILSTCNRVELYAVCGHEVTGADMLRHLFAAHGGVSIQAVRQGSYAHGHQSAVQHLLRVAAGLDSVIVGEHEILGQVRRALGAAREAGALGPVLDRLGSAALACGKRTRASTAFGRPGESIASVGVRLVARERGGLHGASIVILGAGETAGQVLARLASVAGAHLTVINRTHDRAVALAAEHHAEAQPWDALADSLATADVVIGCTAATTPLIDSTLLTRVRGVGGGALVCLDLGVPRDMDPDIASMSGVTLIDMARIELEATALRAARVRDLARADAIVVQETERYMEWWRGRGVASTVARLHAWADSIRDAEIERALARLPDLTPQARAVIGDLATRVVGKLLHEPTRALKGDPEGANMAVVVERLFALGGTGDIAGTDYAVRGHEAAQPAIHQESMAS